MSNNISGDEMRLLAEELDKSIITKTDSDEDETETFYKNILNKLYDKEDVETKTEYLDTQENFVGTKLSFLATYGNMPYLDKFIDIFERKRISLERKGRKEIIMALGERRNEEQRQQQNNMRNLLGI